MLAIDEAKLPPPKPAVAARSATRTPRTGGGDGSARPGQQQARDQQQRRRDHDRPVAAARRRGPRTCTAASRNAPTPLGMATRHRAWLAESASSRTRRRARACPWSHLTEVIWTTTMLHSIHTLNPMCSAKMEKIQVAAGDGPASGLPERGVLGPPIVDPVPTRSPVSTMRAMSGLLRGSRTETCKYG